MYVHCKNCRWSQDDFWSVKGYNPFREDEIKWWREIFEKGMNGKHVEMEVFEAEEREIEYVKNEKNMAIVEFREYLAHEMESMAYRLRNMRWLTWDEFQADSLKECPACGSTELDVD